VFALEKRGYLKAGPWTPEVTVEHPEAGKSSSFLVGLNQTYDTTFHVTYARLRAAYIHSISYTFRFNQRLRFVATRTIIMSKPTERD